MILTVHVKPGAKTTRVTGWLDSGTVVIAVHAPATEGKANAELVGFVADRLRLPKTFVSIKRGLTSRVKHLELPPGTDLHGLSTPPSVHG